MHHLHVTLAITSTDAISFSFILLLKMRLLNRQFLFTFFLFKFGMFLSLDVTRLDLFYNVSFVIIHTKRKNAHTKKDKFVVRVVPYLDSCFVDHAIA